MKRKEYQKPDVKVLHLHQPSLLYTGSRGGYGDAEEEEWG